MYKLGFKQLWNVLQSIFLIFDRAYVGVEYNKKKIVYFTGLPEFMMGKTNVKLFEFHFILKYQTLTKRVMWRPNLSQLSNEMFITEER